MEGQTDRGKTVYHPPLSGSGDIIKRIKCLLFKLEKNNQTLSNDWPTYCHTGIFSITPYIKILCFDWSIICVFKANFMIIQQPGSICNDFGVSRIFPQKFDMFTLCSGIFAFLDLPFLLSCIPSCQILMTSPIPVAFS